MRKIESLQENERVFVKANQWREAAKLFKFCAMPKEDIWVGKNESGFFWTTKKPIGGVEYNLDDVIKNKSKMRKIEDIEEGQYIQVNDIRQAKKILSLLPNPINIRPKTLVGHFIGKNKEGYYWQFDVDSGWVYMAEEFIKPKSKTKQRLKALEARMDKIEERFEPTTKAKDEPKLEVLPEKWCVKMDRQEVVDYCNEHGWYKGNYYLPKESVFYAHFPALEECTTYDEPQPDYTLISFDDFKRLVLDQPKEIDFSVAGQYLQDRHGNLVVTTGLHDVFTFSGTLLDGINTEHSAEWIKNKFTKSNTSITINPQL